MKKIKNTNPSEREFQTWFKENWNGWLSQLHPGQGSDVGIPDLLLGTSSGILPAEVKIGFVEEADDARPVVWCSEVRPAQIVWHKKLADHGFNSILLIGCWCGNDWRVFAVDAINARFFDSVGFAVGQVAFELDPKALEDSLADFVFEQMEN